MKKKPKAEGLKRIRFPATAYLYAGRYLSYMIPIQKTAHVKLLRKLWRVGDGIHRLTVEKREWIRVERWLAKLQLYEDTVLRFTLYVEHRGIASMLALQWHLAGSRVSPPRKFGYRIWDFENSSDQERSMCKVTKAAALLISKEMKWAEMDARGEPLTDPPRGKIWNQTSGIQPKTKADDDVPF